MSQTIDDAPGLCPLGSGNITVFDKSERSWQYPSDLRLNILMNPTFRGKEAIQGGVI
jgi:hypothetical protein